MLLETRSEFIKPILMQTNLVQTLWSLAFDHRQPSKMCIHLKIH